MHSPNEQLSQSTPDKRVVLPRSAESQLQSVCYRSECSHHSLEGPYDLRKSVGVFQQLRIHLSSSFPVPTPDSGISLLRDSRLGRLLSRVRQQLFERVDRLLRFCKLCLSLIRVAFEVLRPLVPRGGTDCTGAVPNNEPRRFVERRFHDDLYLPSQQSLVSVGGNSYLQPSSTEERHRGTSSRWD